MALTDEQLAAAYQTYGHLVLRRCRTILRGSDQAQDALQEVFVRLLRYGDAFAQADAPLRWLYRVADRVCFDLLGRRREAPAEPEAVERLEAADDAAEQLACRDAVLRFLDRFDERTRAVAVLHWVDGLRQEQIAAETGWSRQTVNKKIALLRGRALALRRQLGVAT